MRPGWRDPWPWTAGVLLAGALFVFGMWAFTTMAVRDHRGRQRCERLGGQTWDSGRHCVVGGEVVSTR